MMTNMSWAPWLRNKQASMPPYTRMGGQQGLKTCLELQGMLYIYCTNVHSVTMSPPSPLQQHLGLEMPHVSIYRYAFCIFLLINDLFFF